MNQQRRASQRRSRAMLAASLLAAAAFVAGCGGGTSTQVTFVPGRMLSFGDETSLLQAGGRKFAVNALNTDGSLDCATNPIWVQAVASAYGFVFDECNPTASTANKALMRAGAGAKVDDVKAQVDAQLARTGTGGGVQSGDLVTVMAGAHDVLELYAQYPARPESELIAELRARGERLAAQVNRLVNLGAKVVVVTSIDMGTTPFAAAEKTAKTDTDRAALLTRLSAAINGRLRVNILNDGRFVGLVLADEMVQTMRISPVSFGLSNATTANCTVALPNCTTTTLATDTTAAAWLWADATRMSHGGHSYLGTLAVQRAINNPF